MKNVNYLCKWFWDLYLTIKYIAKENVTKNKLFVLNIFYVVVIYSFFFIKMFIFMYFFWDLFFYHFCGENFECKGSLTPIMIQLKYYIYIYI